MIIDKDSAKNTKQKHNKKTLPKIIDEKYSTKKTLPKTINDKDPTKNT